MSRGEIVNLKVYQRVVDDFQVMHKYNAVGLSEQILLDLQKAGIQLIRILRLSKTMPTTVYYSTVSAFLNSPLSFTNMKDDLNYFVSFDTMIQSSKLRQKKLGEIENG